MWLFFVGPFFCNLSPHLYHDIIDLSEKRFGRKNNYKIFFYIYKSVIQYNPEGELLLNGEKSNN